MSLPAADPDAPTTRRPPRGWLHSLRWTLAGAACAGGVWAATFGLLSVWFGVERIPGPVRRQAVEVSLCLAGAGAVAGLLTGLLAGDLIRGPRRRNRMCVLGLLGLLAGAAGGGLTLAMVLACSRWLPPYASSSLLWAAVGALTGLLGSAHFHDESTPGRVRGPLLHVGLLWALAGAASAAAAWAAVTAPAWFFFHIDLLNPPIVGAEYRPLVCAVLGAVHGLLAGVTAGLACGRHRRVANGLALAAGCTALGALGGGLSMFAAGSSRLHPVASSSLVWAFGGFVAALCAYLWSHRTEPEEDEEEQPADAKVEWVLRGRTRWRERPWVRVLPVLLVSAGAFAGAVLFALSELSLALLAVGILGLVVALVLYNQECRLQKLEKRFRPRE
jgi:hypothetical protein